MSQAVAECSTWNGGVTNLRVAVQLLREARRLLVLENAPRAADKVRKALKSAEGAIRNAQCRPYREARKKRRKE